MLCRVLVMVLMTLLLLPTLCGCQQRRDVSPSPQTQPAVDDAAMRLQFNELLAAHNERVLPLGRFFARGAVDLRWVDDRGKHLETGQCSIWSVEPDQFSMRIDKLGNDLFWIGAIDGSLWMFDLLSNPTTLQVFADDETPVIALGQTLLPISSTSILELSGLRPMGVIAPEQWPDELLVDQARDGMVTGIALGSDAVYRVRFNESTGLLESVEWIAADSGALVHSSLSDSIKVSMGSGLDLHWPVIHRQVRMRDRDSTSEILISFGEATTVLDGQPLQAVFDVEKLQAVLRPEQVLTTDGISE